MIDPNDITVVLEPPETVQPNEGSLESLLLLELIDRKALMTPEELFEPLGLNSNDIGDVREALSLLVENNLIGEFSREGSREIFYRETSSPEHYQGLRYTPPDFEPLF